MNDKETFEEWYEDNISNEPEMYGSIDVKEAWNHQVAELEKCVEFYAFNDLYKRYYPERYVNDEEYSGIIYTSYGKTARETLKQIGETE